jgi:SAM-dependent methyltransferase
MKNATTTHTAETGLQRNVTSIEPRNDCPNCGSKGELLDIYAVPDVPVHSVLLMDSAEEALGYPRRNLLLACCSTCGFIFNRVFDPSVHEYSDRYEETQGFSETFNQFSHRLALDLIERHDLRGKHILEIGCGKGEFLTHICEIGDCTGVGFDPAYVAGRSRAAPSDRVTFVRDFYSEMYAGYIADLVCCKMTLEHIHETRAFISMVRAALDDHPNTAVFFQVPAVERVLQDCAFWDVYYEHCSYFSMASLRYLFEQNGFEVRDVWTDYDGQYLMLDAVPTTGFEDRGNSISSPAIDDIVAQASTFAEQVRKVRNQWKSYLRGASESGQRVVLWGGGSKAVAFLTTLGITNEIPFAVDINPNKHNTFLPGTGHRVVLPEILQSIPPDAVIVMNPIYRDEIRASLSAMDLDPEIIPVSETPTDTSQLRREQ